MKIIISSLTIITLLLFTAFPSFGQLNGIYTIGGTSPDYITIVDAVNDLSTLGVSGNVTFKIRSGNYSGSINIISIVGTSSTNQITFESESGNPSDVKITVPTGTAFFCKNTNHINVKNLSIIGYNVAVGGQYVNFILFDNCIFETNPSSSNSIIKIQDPFATQSCSDIIISNSFITGNGDIFIRAKNVQITKCDIQTTISSNSINIYGNGGYVKIDSTITSKDAQISCPIGDSVICNYSTIAGLNISLNDTTVVVVNNNNLSSLTVSKATIATINNNITTSGATISGQFSGNILCNDNIFNSLIISAYDNLTSIMVKNNLLGSIVAYDITNALITNNIINGGATIQDNISPLVVKNRFNSSVTFNNSSGTLLNKAELSNNFIKGSITLQSNCSYVDILNNNIVTNGAYISSAVFKGYVFTGANNRIINNNCLLKNIGHFYDYGITSSRFVTIDYNNLYFEDVNGMSSSFPYHDNYCFNEGKKRYGFDLNSISVNPMFVSDSLLYSLNPLLDSAGMNVGITTDIDDNPRDIQFPDIGAVEVNGISSPLTGVYTIGSTGDFLNFTEALDSIKKSGVKDSVIFLIEPGTYTDMIIIPHIKIFSVNNLIKFVSSTNNHNDVKIKTTSGTMISIFGESNILFENISFRVDDIYYNHNLMKLSGDVDVTFKKCYFYFGTGGSSLYQDMIVFNECNSYSDSKITFEEDTILSSNNVMNLIGNNSLNNNTTISNCYISDFTYGGSGPLKLINIQSFSNVDIFNNSIRGEGDLLTLNSCHKNISINNNLIGTNIGWSSKSMLEIINCNPINGNIFNNFIIAGSVVSNVVSTGIEISNSGFLKIMHNTVKSNHAVDISLYSSNSASCQVYNNILMNSVEILDSLSYFDYNNMIQVKYGGINYGNNLPLLRSSTGTNLNSINQTPTFVSTYDLHINNPWLRVGRPDPIVTTDIDGEARHPVVPYIGADEFCQHPVSSFVSINTCEGDTTLLVNNSNNLDSLNSLIWDIYADGSVDYSGSGPVSFYFDSVGTYPVKIYSTNTNGCADSAIINVFIGLDTMYNQTISICEGDSILLQGAYQSIAGTYVDSLQNFTGCDSVIYTTLYILPAYFIQDSLSICQGDSISLYGIYQNAAGIYYDSLQTITGCDSILSTQLVINSLPYVSIANFLLDTICSNGGLVSLPIGIPSGGIYSGIGIGGSYFDPSNAGIGTHNVIYTFTDTNFCLSSDTTIITVQLCTEVVNISNDFGILIYPNPNTGLFTIEKPKGFNKEIQVKLLDAISKLIVDKVIPIGQQKIGIDITKYSKGIYYLQLIIDKETFVKQILKN